MRSSPCAKRWAKPACDADCYPTEDSGNNFAALRHVKDGPLGSTGSLYAEFHDGDATAERVDFGGTAKPHLRELYNGTDTWQMTNLLADGTATSGRAALAAEQLSAMLRTWVRCEGHTCS
mmetsp:Transcript_79380/g.157819  ORF Transcript_79380/g.157819 Transcript_79380/m.157819 type:complete len:120 (+) Transcript_79380:852-1211(+)